MRYDPRKCFGYPVLRSIPHDFHAGGGDYRGVIFQVDINASIVIKEDPVKFFIEYRINFSLEAFRNKIATGEIGCFLRVECPDTYWAITEEVPDSGTLSIRADDLRGKVHVSGFILAKKKSEIISDRINPEFGSDRFTVESGQVLALSEPITYYIDKDNIRSIRSMFEFRASDDLRTGEFHVDLYDDYILIRSNKEQEQKLKNAIKGKNGQSIFDNSIVLIAVTSALTKLQDKEARKDFENYKWAQVLQNKCPKLKDADPLAEAQRILGLPLGRLDAVFDEVRKR
ncbi:MAG: hypothetical protein OD811_06890 [Alphaproteobacteria bacterium]